MITYVAGDLFDSPAQVLVNTVNTVGVMGKGIALRFKRAFPEMFGRYQQLCESGKLQVGDLWLYRGPERWILNFPTKQHWRSPSRPEYIEAGLSRFSKVYADAGIASIAFPQLGCGNGELVWESQVRPLMEAHLNKLPVDIFVHLYPSGQVVPEHRAPAEMKRWLRLEVESLAFIEVWADLAALIERDGSFETLTDGVPFRAAVHRQGEEMLHLDTPTGQVDIPREALLGLWQQLRSYGYVTPAVVEANFEPWFRYLIAVLAHLPYVSAVRLARDPAELAQAQSLALQWNPPVRKRAPQVTQLQLA